MAGVVRTDWPSNKQLIEQVRQNGRAKVADGLGVTLSGLTHHLHKQGIAAEARPTRKPGSKPSPTEKPLIDWPAPGEIQQTLDDSGSIMAAARWLGVSRGALTAKMHSLGLRQPRRPRKGVTPAVVAPEHAGVKVEGDTAVITEPISTRPQLGNLAALMRERGLNPDEWVVVTTTLNEWDGPVAGGGTQRLRQWKVTLRRAPHLVLAMPAQHIPPVKRTRVGPRMSDRPETILVEGDHQAPYHDENLHQASLRLLLYLQRKQRLAEHVLLGDTGDFPTISKHADHPSAQAKVNEVIQDVYRLLREKREVAPNARCRKLKGNHDWRVEGELLARAERMYAIKPADTGDGDQEPALSLKRLLHLEKLGIELVEDPRGWQHAEVELVPGVGGLVVRHGWLTGEGTATKSLLKRGRSIIVGHTHQREHVFRWDPSAETERQGVVIGAMCLVRDQRFPHFATCDSWTQGCGVVTRWPDGRFIIEHALWDGTYLRWRDLAFFA